MKQINIWNALLMILLFSSCGKEAMTDMPMEEQPTATVSLNVQIDNNNDDAPITRVGGDQKIPAGYQLRYIMEVYTTADKLITREVRIGSTSYTVPFSFDNVRLPINDKYVAVCWADLIPTGTSKANLYYNADQLTAIKQNITNDTNPDLLDAYTGKLAFEINDKGISTPLNITLKRPLVQIRLKDLRLEGATAAYYYIDYQTEVLTTYNAFTQKVITTGSDKTSRDKGISNHVAYPQNDFIIKDYVFMDDVSRQLSLNISGNGHSYNKNGTALHAPLTKPNVLLTLKGPDATGYLLLTEQP